MHRLRHPFLTCRPFLSIFSFICFSGSPRSRRCCLGSASDVRFLHLHVVFSLWASGRGLCQDSRRGACTEPPTWLHSRLCFLCLGFGDGRMWAFHTSALSVYLVLVGLAVSTRRPDVLPSPFVSRCLRQDWLHLHGSPHSFGGLIRSQCGAGGALITPTLRAPIGSRLVCPVAYSTFSFASLMSLSVLSRMNS